MSFFKTLNWHSGALLEVPIAFSNLSVAFVLRYFPVGAFIAIKAFSAIGEGVTTEVVVPEVIFIFSNVVCAPAPPNPKYVIARAKSSGIVQEAVVPLG